MKSTPLAIPDVLLLEPRVFTDARGHFFESHSDAAFTAATGIATRFVQDNHSLSQRGVVRALHYQLPPHAQGKLVRVVRGSVFDVAVDIRRHSPTFGQWVGATLSAENKHQLWIPAGFAHGFMALEDKTEFLYKVTDIYAPETARVIAYNDPTIGIEWPATGTAPVLSAADAAGALLKDAEVF